jgi:hypothetical protein
MASPASIRRKDTDEIQVTVTGFDQQRMQVENLAFAVECATWFQKSHCTSTIHGEDRC